jgi:CDP-diglyceride synthetase
LDVFSQQFYLLIIVERLVTSIFLVALISVPVQNGILIVLFLSQMIIIIKKKPYKGKRKWLRPVLNMINCIMIQLIYQITNFQQNPKGVISIYGPMVILCLILICLVYSIYYLVLDVREAVESVKTFMD